MSSLAASLDDPFFLISSRGGLLLPLLLAMMVVPAMVLAAQDAEVMSELAPTLVVGAADRRVPKFTGSDSTSLFHLDLVDGCELLFRYLPSGPMGIYPILRLP